MQSSIQNHKNPTWIISFSFSFSFFFTFFSLSLSLSDPRISSSGIYCGTSRPPPNTSFVPTFVKEMESLSAKINTSHYATHFTNSTLPIYALVQCFQDLSQTDCLLCYVASRTTLPRCLPALSARIYLDGCFLRYDNYNFYAESVDPVRDTVNCSSNLGSVDSQIEKLEFVENVKDLVSNVTRIAVETGGFGHGEVNGVFGLAQCWESVGRDGCKECLEKAKMEVRKCTPKREGRALNAGCYLRYSTVKFYNNDGEDDEHGDSARRLIVALVLAGAALVMLCFVAAFVVYAKLSKMKKDSNNHALVSMNKSCLYFKYETLEKATDYFNPSRKIGEGGAGSVYKGTLPDGKIVAVKRLIFNTSQWVDEFFNEVNLICGIQHKNLVKLLGCSIEGPESLLVYEYVPNNSLDQLILDKNMVRILNWKQRVNIIVGTAEGLAYLHEGCQTKIIHRDIKGSNILLDENLNPKVADFGLARCLAADKSHLSTGIAGTLGYMAPEYLIRGQLTEKADVYSFGVLVLEIVCGRRNNTSVEDSGSLLQGVWKLYKYDKLIEAVDPCLRDDFPAKEASDILQIGLLCAQASAISRPSMVQVVQMLMNEESEIPIPKQPPFINPSILEPTSSTRSNSIHSLESNNVRELQSPYNFSESSSMKGSDRPTTSVESMQK